MTTPSPVDTWRHIATCLGESGKLAPSLLAACDRIEALETFEEGCRSAERLYQEALAAKLALRSRAELAEARVKELEAEVERIDKRREKSAEEWLTEKTRAELAESRVKELEAHFEGCQECWERRAVEAESRLAIAVEVIEALLNKVNRVTAPWRHQHGNADAGVMDAAIDALSIRQIEAEAALAKIEEQTP